MWPEAFPTQIYKESNQASILHNLENIPPQNISKDSLLSISKKNAPNLKASKANMHSIRAGDWVCLLCNNLNFSFRNECNRCQKQTKKQNYIQNLLFLEEPRKIQNKNERKPLSDITNLQLENKRTECHSQWGKGHNHGFENVLLLTPPRPLIRDLNVKKGNFIGNQQNLPFNSPNSETNKKIIKPYNSPQEIPSISPILKSEFLRGTSKSDDICAKNLTEFLCEKIYEDSREDEANEDNRLEPLDQIFSKLIEEKEDVSKELKSNFNDDASFASSTPQNGQNRGETGNILNSLIGFIGNPCFLNLSTNSIKDNKGKKKNKGKTPIIGENERKSDWYCPHCTNLNYSFRIVCNRCQMMKPLTK